MSPRPRIAAPGGIALAAVLAVAFGVVPERALAGSIGFRTDAEVTAGNGVDAKVTLTHTGDEAASDVKVVAELLGKSVDGETISTIGPGKSQVWNFHLEDQIPAGVYTIVLRTRYSDDNGYAFEVVSTASATARVKPAPRLFGSFDVPRVGVGGEAKGRLTVKRPEGRSGNFDVQLVAPAGIEVSPQTIPLDFDANGKASANFQVRNLRLLSGTAVNMFGLITGNDPGFPQVDAIRGSVTIGPTSIPVTFQMFYQAAAAVFAALVGLEALAWAGARRSRGA